MSSTYPPDYYIALQDVPLVKDDKQSNWLGKKARELKEFVAPAPPTHLLKGELLIVDDNTLPTHFRGRSASDPSKQFVCPKFHVASLTETEYQILAPIKLPSDRLVLYRNQYTLGTIKTLQSDDKIWVSVPVQQDATSGLVGSSCVRATIRYIGGIQGEVGRYFGVELPVCQLLLLTEYFSIA